MAEVTPTTKLCTHDLWYMDSTGQPFARQSRVAEVLGRAEPSDRGALIEKGILEHGDYVWLGSAFGVSRSRGAIDAFIAFCEQKDYLDTCYQDWPLAVWVALQPGGTYAFSQRKLFGYRLHGKNYSGASQTHEKLRRNLTKSRDTLRLIEEIIIAKHGDVATLRHNRKVRLNYELLLSTTRPGRKQLVMSLFRSLHIFRADYKSAKLVLRVVLALLLGPVRAHSAIERLKR